MFISFTHLFGRSAAVVDFNRLPELMTALCRKIGACPTFFDDQGTLDFHDRRSDGYHRRSMTAPDFAGAFCNLVGRPFDAAKRLPAGAIQLHLGLQNNFLDVPSKKIWMEPKPGNIEELTQLCTDLRTRKPQQASLQEITKLAGKLMFLCMTCFDQSAPGGIQPMYAWLADNVDSDASLQARHTITAALARGLEFFRRGLPWIRSRVYHLSRVSTHR